MVIRSDNSGTGSIGKSSGNIIGDVTVERFLPAKKFAGFRMLAPSVNSTSSIKNNWQEGVNNSNRLSNIDPFPTYGTHITGSATGENGFDASETGQPSMFVYNWDTEHPVWLPITNTNQNKLDAKEEGYLVYVRGNRSTDLNKLSNQSNNTTLRSTGSVLTGTVSYTSLKGDGKNSLIANPYASPLDWAKLQASNNGQFENYYTLWDPNVGSKGGYVTIDATGTASVRTSQATTDIQTGQAFIVKTKEGVSLPNFVITEADKSINSNTNVFRGTNTFVSKLYTSLYFTNENDNRSLADGVLSRFDEGYSSNVDGDDAEDISNFDENISFRRSGKELSIESRPKINNSDTLFLSMNNMKPQAYEWQFNATDFDPSLTFHAFLIDQYLGTEIPIDLDGTTIVAFEITKDPASADKKRFSISFQKLKTLPVNILSVKGYVYSNGINVDWKTASEINMKQFEIERSTNGQVFSAAGVLQPKGAGNSINMYSWFDADPKQGFNYYRIRSVSKDGSVQYSEVIRVALDKASVEMNVFPNPLKGGDLSVKLGNLAKGTYTIRLVNFLGQVLLNTKVEHSGGSLIHSFSSNGIASGTYELELLGNNFKQRRQLVKL